SGADALARSAPAFAAVFDDERLSDEATGEIGRRAADAENVGGEALIVGRVADFFQSGDELVTEHVRLRGHSGPPADGRNHTSEARAGNRARCPRATMAPNEPRRAQGDRAAICALLRHYHQRHA